MKKCVQSNQMAPIQQQWLMSMLRLVPQSLMEGKDQQLLTEKLLGEVISDYERSMKRYMGKYQKLHYINISVLIYLNILLTVPCSPSENNDLISLSL